MGPLALLIGFILAFPVFILTVVALTGGFPPHIFIFFVALPVSGFIWFTINCFRFSKASKSERKMTKVLVPLIISAFPAAFAVFIGVFIIGIFTGAISLM